MKAKAWAAIGLLPIAAALAFALRAPEGDFERGRLLYLRGMDAEGAPLVGRLALGEVELTGASAACGRCHGADGAGTREAGLDVPAITARDLRAASERRGPLDEGAVVEAITAGRLPDGRLLAPVMPRYRLDERDRRDLLAWLRRLGEAVDPGVTQETIRVGAFVEGESGARLAAVLEACFRDQNRRGGIHRRRIELLTHPAGAEGEDEFLAGGIFALVGSALPRSAAARERIEREGIPIVAPVGARADGLDALAFRLYPTRAELARIAVQSALAMDPPRRPMIVHADDPEGRVWRNAAQREAARRGRAPLPVLALPRGALDTDSVQAAVQAAGADLLLFWGDAAALGALDEVLATGIEVQAPVDLAAQTIAVDRIPSPRIRFWSPTLVGGRPVRHSSHFSNSSSATGSTARARRRRPMPGRRRACSSKAFASRARRLRGRSSCGRWNRCASFRPA